MIKPLPNPDFLIELLRRIDGARELENMGILEILRSIAVKYGESYSEEAQYYRLNPFYDMNEFDRSIAAFGEKYSKVLVAWSIRVAGTFWKSHDLHAIETICYLTGKFGRAKASSAARRISKLPNFSALKSLATFVEWMGYK